MQLKDGRTLRGFVRNEGNHVLPLQTVDGRLVAVDKATAVITRETGSAMPPLKATPDEMRDLIAFLSGLGADLKVGTTPVGADLGRVEACVRRRRPALGRRADAKADDFAEILKPRAGDWPTYHGRLDGNRHSALAQITTANVRSLSPKWIHSVRGFDNEMTPLVLDGIMYITATNQVSALDAATGREIWRFSRPRSTGLRGDAAIGFNRGVAVLGSRVFLVTDNAHLVAVSRINGALLWEVVLPENTALPYGGTMAPLVVGDLVIAGVSGGDEGIRGFLAAYRVDTGEQAWRFWTVPARGEPASDTWKGSADLEKGGGATWLTGSYDAETDTLFWPTGNPYPDTDGSERQGDNLYTNAVLALEAKTGKLRWHYQFTPHDLWDWDAQEPLVLIDAVFQGQPRKLLLQANRNGFFYVLDRTNGKVLLAPALRSEAHLGEWDWPGWPSAVGGWKHAGRERRDDMPGDTRRHELDVYVVQPRNAVVLRDGGGELLRVSQHDVRWWPRPRRGTARSRRRRARCARLPRGVRLRHRRSAFPAEASTAAERAAGARWRCARSIWTPDGSRGRFRRQATRTTTPAHCRPQAGSCSTDRRAASSRRSMRSRVRISGTSRRRKHGKRRR